MRRSVCHVVTVADSLIFLDDTVVEAKRRGFAVSIVSTPDRRLDQFGRRLGVRTVSIPMPRRISIGSDLVALDGLARLVARLRPGIVHAHTPKGGLLGMLAASAADVPVRLYHLRGLPFETQRGTMRALLMMTERLSCRAATRVICQSESLRSTAVRERLVPALKAEVVLGGSNGVDAVGRFDPLRWQEAGRQLRLAQGIAPAALVVAFVGRVVGDKGVPELLRAFESLGATHPGAVLLVAGPIEERDAIDGESLRLLRESRRVRYLGPVDEPAAVYAAADLVALPSHREGFPNVPLEAASMGLPVVATRVGGCVDAVVDGVTGTLVRVEDAGQLADALGRYLDDAGLRREHGARGRSRVLEKFRRDEIASAIVDLYEAELDAAARGRV